MANQVFRQEGMSQDQRAELARAQAASDQAAADLATAKREALTRRARADAGAMRDGETFPELQARIAAEETRLAEEMRREDAGDDDVPELDAERAYNAMVQRKTEAWKAPRVPRARREPDAPDGAPSFPSVDDQTADLSAFTPESMLAARMAKGRRK